MRTDVAKGLLIAVALATVPVVAATGIASAPSDRQAIPSTPAATACGHERWNVKTLQDPAAAAVSFNVKSTTVDHLRGLTAPHLSQSAPRQRRLETSTYRVHA